jgi:nucleoside-diphosphate-sugar epimerase
LSLVPQAAPVFCSGATGFIGGAILRRLVAEGVPALGGVRGTATLAPGVIPVVTGDLSKEGFVLPPVEMVVHAAGLGHRRGVSPEVWGRENVDAAVHLAHAARAAGAKRFVLISTAHIHGRVHAGMVTDSTPPNPMDLYAESKLQAEYDVAAAFGPGLSILRPVAVIGPGCPGNIPLLLKLLARGVPLPFGAIANRRSFIHCDDLASLVIAVLRSKKPPETVLAAPPETISTPDLIRALAQGLGVRAKIWSWPPEILMAGAALLGRMAMWQSLAGDFVPNPVAALGLGWRPAESLAESLAQTSRYYHTTGTNA